jgi:hypothetical protein
VGDLRKVGYGRHTILQVEVRVVAVAGGWWRGDVKSDKSDSSVE